MSLPALYSRRKRQSETARTDVYRYDEFPANVRVQLVHILTKAIGPTIGSGQYGYAPGHDVYKYVVETLREEKGVFSLTRTSYSDIGDEFIKWLLDETDVVTLLDGLELVLKCIDVHVRSEMYKFQPYIGRSPDEAISDFNDRLLEASIGYQYNSKNIIRIDSELIHVEVVLPALRLLKNERFSTAEKEYLAAHSSYRLRDYETCLVECAKAFESVLKIISSKRRWGVADNGTAKQLLDAAYAAEFIDKELQAEFTSLRGLLESAVPTMRNKMAAHGAGTQARRVPQHFAAFQLHQTASAIVFLVEHHKASK